MEPMQLEIAAETELFLLACLLGAGMGAIYDMFRVLRNTVEHNKVFVFAEDFVYALMFGFAYFTFCTGLTRGIRGFVFVGMLAGCAVERLTIGRLLVFALSEMFEVIWKTVFAPVIGVVFKIFGAIHKRIVKKRLTFFKSEKNIKKRLQVEDELLYNEEVTLNE